ncbi:MAG TPA: HD domain-containing protein [Myxococcota bacterium]|nr:HD domain-containing protein [Myxococcota bacterium]
MDDLEQAQESLSKALDRARAGEDKELAGQVRDGGERFVRLVQASLRLTRTHALDNHAFDDPVSQLESTIQSLYTLLGALHIVAVEDQIYLNDVRIRLDEQAEGAPSLGMDLRRHGVGGVSFHQPLQEAGWRAFIGALATAPAASQPRLALQARMNAAGLATVELFGVFRFHVAGEEGAALPRAASAIASQAVGVLESSCENLSMNRLPNPLPVRRLVAEMLEAGSDAPVEEIPGASAYSTHTWRVTQLSVLLGKALGLSEADLQDLGVSAMFHDVGYAAREGGGDGEPGFAPPFERHSAAGARLILKQRGFHEAKIRRALCCLEHHVDYNDEGGKPSLLARIVRIAEDFDNLVRPGGMALSPALALRQMQAGSNTRYDPLLFQAFVNAMGAFPPGTRLELADGTRVMSAGFARSPETFGTPTAFVILPDGSRGEWLDLAETVAVKRVVL